MDTKDLEGQLTGCILDVLRERAFAPPATRDPAIRDPYFDGITHTLMERIKADGWLIAPPSSRWRNDGEGEAHQPSSATPAELEADLRSCLRFALALYPHRPPRTRDFSVTERYHSAVATAAVKQILSSNWALAPTLQKIPPARWHSTPAH